MIDFEYRKFNTKMTLLDKEQQILLNYFPILQSHYPPPKKKKKKNGRWAKIGKIGRRRPIVGRHWHRFWIIFWLADDIFCRSTQVKSFVIRSTDFQEFCRRWSVGRWSADSRPNSWRNFHHDIDRSSPDHRASIGQLSPDGPSMTFDQRTVCIRPNINFNVR